MATECVDTGTYTYMEGQRILRCTKYWYYSSNQLTAISRAAVVVVVEHGSFVQLHCVLVRRLRIGDLALGVLVQ